MPAPRFGVTQLVYVIIGVIVLVVLVRMVDGPRDGDSRLSNAAEELGDGVDNAVKEMNPNRSTGDKVGDAIEDAGKNIRDGSSN